VRLCSEILTLHGSVLVDLERVRSAALEAAADIGEQVANLVFPGFLAATPHGHLVDLPRYLKAAQQRIVTLSSSPARDAAGMAAITGVEDAYAELVAAAPPGRLPDFVEEIGWLVEELRVSLFAQGLGTKQAVSEKRVRQAIRAAAQRLRDSSLG
jgi:ATP-dependent helicase HrpA